MCTQPVHTLLLVVVALSLVPWVGSAELYSSVAAMLDLGAGARPLAMGGAFVGLADDGYALMFNPAGLSGLRSLWVVSSGEVRPGFGIIGQLGVVFPGLGIALQYFDFGEITETDEFGNAVGSFTYRTYTLVLGGGYQFGAIGLRAMPFFRDLRVGIKAKYHVVRTLEPGSGSGMAFDLSLHYASGQAERRDAFLTRFGLGLVVENVVGVPLRYTSGHVEEWPKCVTLGLSTTLLNSWTLVADFGLGRGPRFGLEWFPTPILGLRVGMRGTGIVIWSLGLGVKYGTLVLDYAIALHPYLPPQHRISFALDLL